MPDVYVGVGSNIEPVRNIAVAVEALREAVGAIALSSAYRNPPVGFNGDDFLNLVLRFSSASGPESVEKLLGDLERNAGRERARTESGPRSLDLDLLLYGSLVDAKLRLPRDDILAYSFVLCPLAELAPDLTHPISGMSIAECWKHMMAVADPSMKNVGSLPEMTVAGRSNALVSAES